MLNSSPRVVTERSLQLKRVLFDCLEFLGTLFFSLTSSLVFCFHRLGGVLSHLKKAYNGRSINRKLIRGFIHIIIANKLNHNIRRTGGWF